MKKIFFILLLNAMCCVHAAEHESKSVAEKDLVFPLPAAHMVDAAAGSVDHIFYGLSLGEKLGNTKLTRAKIETAINVAFDEYYRGMLPDQRALITKPNVPEIAERLILLSKNVSLPVGSKKYVQEHVIAHKGYE